MTKTYTLTIAVGENSMFTDEEKEKLLAFMLKKIGGVNASMGEAHAIVSAIIEAV